MLAHEGVQLRFVARIGPLPEGDQRDGAVHRARVEIEDAQTPRQRLRDGRLATARRTVDRDVREALP